MYLINPQLSSAASDHEIIRDCRPGLRRGWSSVVALGCWERCWRGEASEVWFYIKPKVQNLHDHRKKKGNTFTP